MNDEFLTQYRKVPRAEFAVALYQRISHQPQPRFTFRVLNRLTLRNAGALLALLLFVAACTYVAATQTPYRKVGNIWLTVQKTVKIEFSSVEMATEATQEQLVVDQCALTREEAGKVLDFDFLLPTAAPKGFATDGLFCGVEPISNFVSLSWKGNDGKSYIVMMIQNMRWYDRVANIYRVGPASVWQPVAPGSYEEVQVNGQPAVLVRGDWEQPPAPSEMPTTWELEWDKDLGLHLYWVNGEELYDLHTNADIAVEELIKMAESAK